MSSGARRTRDTRRGMAHPIPMEISRHENGSVPSNTDIDEYTPVPGSQLDGQRAAIDIGKHFLVGVSRRSIRAQ